MPIKHVAPALLLILINLASCARNPSEPTTLSNPGESVSLPGLPSPSPQQSPDGTVLTSSDGNTGKLIVPDGWAASEDLNEEAQIQTLNAAKALYIVVLSENKSNLQNLNEETGEMTLAKHSEITRSGLIRSFKTVEVTGPTDVTTVNGNPAIQYKIDGTMVLLNGQPVADPNNPPEGPVQQVDVIFLHTTVETPNHYNQILAWTLADNFEQNQPELQKIIASFEGR